MFPRFFIALCALALFVVVSADSEQEILEAEPRNPALALAMRTIAKQLGKRVGKCLAEAANHCKANWKHFHALVDCAKEFAETNKGRCLL